MKRPLAWIGFSASAAFLLAGVGGVTALMALAAAGVLMILVTAFPPFREAYAQRTVGVTLLVSVAVFGLYEWQVFRPAEPYAGQTVSVTLQITGEPQVYATCRRYPAEVTAGDIPVGTKVALMVVDNEVYPEPYDTVSGQVSFALSEEAYRLQDRAKGIALSGFLDAEKGVQINTPTQTPWQKTLMDVRRSASRVVDTYLTGDAASMVKSLCLGNRGDLSEAVSDDFRRCGVSHLLVVSGLHVSIVAAAVLGLWRLLRVRRRVAAVLTMAAIVGFMLLVGLTPSVKRAGVMALMVLAGTLFKREADGINSVGLALTLMGLVDPYMVWDVGLQLSVGATMGILWLVPRLHHCFLIPCLRQNRHWYIRILFRPAQLAAVSLSAMVISPLLILYFGKFSLVFLPANLLTSLPAAMAVMSGLLGTLLGGWFSLAAKGCFFVAGLLTRWLQTVTHWLGSLPLAMVDMRHLFVFVWLVITVLAVILLWKHLRPVRRAVLALGSVSALMAGVIAYQYGVAPITTCTVQNTGDGLIIQMEWAEGNLLTVMGDDRALLRQTVKTLAQNDTQQLSAVVLPDLEDDCLSALPLLTATCPIRQVIAPATGYYAPSVISLFGEDTRIIAQKSEVVIGDTHRIVYTAGWVMITTGETRWLIATDHADGAQLPSEWQTPDVLITDGSSVGSDHINPALTVGTESGKSQPQVTVSADQPLRLYTCGRQDVYAE